MILACQDCLKHKLNQSIQHPVCPERKRAKPVVKTERRFNGESARSVRTLTTAFLGLACSWDISSSCSGVAFWTRLNMVNQPLREGEQKKACRVRESSLVQLQKTHRPRHKSVNIPGILRWLGKHLVCSLICHNIQSILFLMIVHNLPKNRKKLDKPRSRVSVSFKQQSQKVFSCLT